jgi:aquaporin Z
MEAGCLAIFMVSACSFGVLLEHPMSPAYQAIEDGGLRRALMGVAMGLTAMAIIYSPWGRRSGAHLNPALTLNYFLLRKVAPWDAFFYAAFQFLGGAIGVVIADLLIGFPLRHSAVYYVVTVPGPGGPAVAFWAELLISGALMTTVLMITNTPRLARYTGVAAGTLVALFITFEAPLSGMSMNPARTLSSALAAGEFPALWVYFTAPPAGMLLGTLIYRAVRGTRAVYCAKLNHDNRSRCIFHCRFAELEQEK